MLKAALFTLAQQVQASRLVPILLRRFILKAMGFDLGQRVRISANVSFFSTNTKFGSRVFVNHQCFFDASAPITVEDDVAIGPRVMILTSTHQMAGPGRRAGELTAAAVLIGEGCWIGAGATILPGVSVGAGCVIAAGAVVTRSTIPNSLYAGSPARHIRELAI